MLGGAPTALLCCPRCLCCIELSLELPLRITVTLIDIYVPAVDPFCVFVCLCVCVCRDSEV